MMIGDTFEVLKKLVDCDYPFQWEPKTVLETVPNDMVHRLTDQLNEKVFEDDFYFEHLMLYIGLSYEYAINGGIEEAVRIFKTGENELREFIRTLPSNMNMAVQHIVSATRAHLLLQQNNSLDLAVTIMSEIPPLDSMNAENRAALCGLRAVFFDEYGISGTKRALELASKAIDMNANEPMWYFLKGKYLGRLRRVERPYDIPHAEEIEFLKKANNARENASYVIFTAQMYCETANRIYRKFRIRQTLYPSIKVLVDKLNQESLKLYNKAIELKPNCSHIMFRCAKGFIKLLAMICDKCIEKRTKQLLEDGLKMAPENGYGNHVMAQFYERIKKDPIKALKFLRICESKRIFGAVMDLIRLEYRSADDVNFVRRLTNLLDVHKEKSRKCQIYSQLISYHIFVTDDLKEACTHTYVIMDLDPNCDNLLEHRAICIRYRKTFNLYELLVDEIKIRLQDDKRFDDKENYYRKFLSDLAFTGQSVSLSKPRYLKNEILNVIYAPPTRQTSILGSRPRKRRKNSKIPQHVRIMAIGGLRTVHKTDVDESMNEIFTRCQEELDKKDKNKSIFVCRTSSDSNWLSTPPSPVREECDNSKNTEAHNPAEEVVRVSGEEVKTAVGNEENDESDDDDTFRMSIYKKLKEKSKETAVDASNVIVPALRKLKIGDESPKMSEIYSDYEKNSRYSNEETENYFDSDDSMDDDETLNNIEDEFHVTETVSASENERSDESDDLAFRMMIQNKTKKKMEQDLNTTDIVTPLKKLKIAEE